MIANEEMVSDLVDKVNNYEAEKTIRKQLLKDVGFGSLTELIIAYTHNNARLQAIKELIESHDTQGDS